MKTSLNTLLFFSLGIFAALIKLIPEGLYLSQYAEYALYLLIFMVGLSIGGDASTWQSLRQLNTKILLIPLCTVIGSLLGGMISSSLFENLSIQEGMAVSAGFGYYSLSSIIITKLHSETLGVIALLSNITREIVTLLLTPLLAKHFGKFTPIAAGGATTMDTTLPIITLSSGKNYAIPAVIHGVILSMLVPFLLSFILNM